MVELLSVEGQGREFIFSSRGIIGTLNPVAILRTQKQPCYTGSTPSIGGSLLILRVQEYV